MSYTKTVWETGDTITSEKLNNAENGIEAANDIQSTIVIDDVRPVNSIAVLSYIASLDASEEEY